MSDENRTPEGVGALLGDAGPSPTVTLNGKTWTIGHPTQKAKAALELLVAESANRNLDDLRGVLPLGEWEQERTKLSALLRARAWQTFGPLWVEQCDGPQGDALFLLSLLRANHPTATLDDAAALWAGAPDACKDALAIVVPGFFDLLVSALPRAEADRRATASQMRAGFLAALGRPTG